MGSAATLHPYCRPGPNLTGSGPVLTVIEGRRGKPEMLLVRATEVADLVDELTAAGQEMVGLASQIDLALGNRRPDLVPALTDRLYRLGVQYRDCARPEGEPA